MKLALLVPLAFAAYLTGLCAGCDPRALAAEASMEESAGQLKAARSARESRRVRRSLPSLMSYENLTPNNRTLCPEVPPFPANRIYTDVQVAALRAEMIKTGSTGGHVLSAYFIPYEDQHGSGGADHDKRLKYMSGFSGSNGYAWVTTSQAALWTDGRYFLQGDQQLDCNWILMEIGEPGYPSATNWLIDRLPAGSRVGADPKLVPINTWQAYETLLAEKNITIEEINIDLIDQIWTVDRPPRPNNEVYEHTIDFAGETWQNKIGLVRQSLTDAGVDALVITALDETAWLFNLRGSDRATSPLFYSYGIITQSEIRLYMINHLSLLTPIRTHLNTGTDGTCGSQTGLCVNVRDYQNIMGDITAMSSDGAINSLWITPSSSYAVYSATGDKRYILQSPIKLMKSVKNNVEQRRYFECQVRDSAAVVEFVSQLEKGVQGGQTNWTEVSAAEYLTTVRSRYEHYKMDSFDAISASGPNGAVIHYRATPETDRTITTSEMYLLDSGGNYLDGTTDITRTFHFGTPTAIEKEAYTRVLLGAIELADTVWRGGLKGSDIDARARTPLWQNGWDYNHGTGHGIGYFLNVHEGPGRINIGYDPSHSALYTGMFFSDEPGYYEDGEFGVRLETIVGVVDADVPNRFGGRDYLTFRAATLVPFETNLIDYDLLDTSHRRWLNAYNMRCLEETGAYLTDRNKQEAYEWLAARTHPIPEDPNWGGGESSGAPSRCSGSVLVALTIFTAAGIL